MEILKNKYSKIILGILWGFGLAIIFRYACNSKKCIIFKSPEPAKIKNSIFNHDNKCFKYESVSTSCETDLEKIDA